uniref:Inositol 1,4,5-trisphosphate/ryanodine receptor domain-containing protein n=1 Tax=Gopherus agassizii TaxID=38772 RepID=A0A452I5C0_9SAUR
MRTISKKLAGHTLRIWLPSKEKPYGWPVLAESGSWGWGCFIDDEVVLQCTATIHKEQQKLCLAAEGFGNRLCFLESTSNSKNVPPDLSICTFVLEQSLSVRALQEMLANTEEKAEGVSNPTAQGGGHRTLLYGHAILLRHSYSGMLSWDKREGPFMA